MGGDRGHPPSATGPRQLPRLHGHSLSSLAFTRYSSCSFVSDLLSDRSCVCRSRDCSGGNARQARGWVLGCSELPRG